MHIWGFSVDYHFIGTTARGLDRQVTVANFRSKSSKTWHARKKRRKNEEKTGINMFEFPPCYGVLERMKWDSKDPRRDVRRPAEGFAFR